MGQSLVSPVVHRPAPRKGAANDDFGPRISIFPTDLGWFGLWGTRKTVAGLTIGHTSAAEVRRYVQSPQGVDSAPAYVEYDWQPALRRKLCDFARGIATDFQDIEVDLAAMTPFRQRVLRLTRKISYGTTASYGELAKRAGSPNAARAVGSTMKSNPLPLIIPCHRIVASGGAIGGYSAPQGIGLKQRLLAMEAQASTPLAR
jgi:methylated-DNA-[protein]-cysteine S-methyltransferase